MAVASSALKAQQARMRVIAENIANANSTARTPGTDQAARSIALRSAQRLPGLRRQSRQDPNMTVNHS